jgi:catechol 2,3-dioxygenase-like lactoylglutathione lyase family enzyme
VELHRKRVTELELVSTTATDLTLPSPIPMRLSLKTKISTPKYRQTREFFETVFRMRIAEEWNDPGDVGVILALPGGREEAYLEIYSAEVASSFTGLSLQFRVNSLSEFLSSLPKDISYDGPTARPWGSTYLYLRDPNDIQVIVYEGGL